MKLKRDMDSILRNLPVGIIELCAEARVTLINQVAQDFVPLVEDEREQRLDVAVMDTVDEQGRPLRGKSNPWLSVFERRRPIREVVVGIKKDTHGIRTWLQISAEPTFNEDGDVQSVLFSLLDISQRKHQEQLIAAQQLQLTESSRMSSLGILAGGIAHEINNPLAIIHGRCELLIERAETKGVDCVDVVKDLNKVVQLVRRIHRITQDVLRFAGDVETSDSEEVSSADFVENVLDLCRERFCDEGIRLEITNQCPSAVIVGNRTKLMQAFYNVIINSYEAAIQTSRPWIRISIAEESRDFTISVEDNGPGIAESDRSKVMLPFYTTKAPGKGTGMGLSLARTILERHDGTLVLDPDASHTKFVLRFAKKPSAVQARAS